MQREYMIDDSFMRLPCTGHIPQRHESLLNISGEGGRRDRGTNGRRATLKDKRREKRDNTNKKGIGRVKGYLGVIERER